MSSKAASSISQPPPPPARSAPVRAGERLRSARQGGRRRAPPWRLRSAWIAGRPRCRSRIALAASRRTLSSPLSSSSPSRSTARGDNCANRARRPSGGFGLPPALPLVPGTHRPRSSRAMKISCVFERYTADHTRARRNRDPRYLSMSSDERSLPSPRARRIFHQRGTTHAGQN